MLSCKQKIERFNRLSEEGKTLYEKSIGEFSKIIYKEIDLKIYNHDELVKVVNSIDIPRFLGNVLVKGGD